jgi:[ribosomal protein S5]-alanine N-acetyltransferase
MGDLRANKNPLSPFSEVPPLTFETERLRLRAATPSDLTLIFDLYAGDPVATKYMAWHRWASPEEGLSFFEMVDSSFKGTPVSQPNFSWLIQLKSTGEFIGGCGIGATTETSVDGGYILTPRFWRQGYAAEAFRAVVEWACTQPNIQRIEATHHPDNPASGRVLCKSGLTFDRVNRTESRYPNVGEVIVDELVYAWKRPSRE